MNVGRDIDKLGYKSVETCELHFDNFSIPAENLIGEVEGQGFKQVMVGLKPNASTLRREGSALHGQPLRKRFAMRSAASRSGNRSPSIKRSRTSWPIWRLASKHPGS